MSWPRWHAVDVRPAGQSSANIELRLFFVAILAKRLPIARGFRSTFVERHDVVNLGSQSDSPDLLTADAERI
jgi:hypothetical protein